jgi:hypothetical protein
VRWYWLLVAVGVASAVAGVVLATGLGSETIYCGGVVVDGDPIETARLARCHEQLETSLWAWRVGVGLVLLGLTAMGFGVGFR